MELGPRTLVRIRRCAYTLIVGENKMKTLKTALLGLAAVLLLVTPPAQAKARKHGARGAKASRLAGKSKHRKADAGSQALIKMGLSRLDAQDYAGAIASFKQASKTDRGNAAAFFLLGYAHYQRGFQGGTPASA